jgi:hypothetical protein
MKIECVTSFKHGHEQYGEGDVRVVDDDLGAYFCAASWAKDLDGKVPTGDAKLNHTLKVDSLLSKTKTSKPGKRKG